MNQEKKSIKHLTIICPVHNEEKVVPLFFERALPVIKELSARYRVDLLFLNNASTDGTYQTIQKLRLEYPFVYVITLSSNVGSICSLECGVRNALGDVFAIIDVDCEDPPEMLLEFVKRYEEGYDVVYGERKDREAPNLIRILRKLFYHMVRRIADEDIVLYMGVFLLFTAEVRDAAVQEHNSFLIVNNSIARVGFHRIGIPYKRQHRIGGQSHYNLWNLTMLAIAGFLSASTLMLRMPIYLLPFWLLLTAVLGVAQIVIGNPWFLLANVLLTCAYLGGAIAFTALYVARAYKNGLRRPNYVIHHRYTHGQVA